MVASEEYDLSGESRGFREVTADFQFKSFFIRFLNYVH